jgi:hypothetical protein
MRPFTVDAVYVIHTVEGVLLSGDALRAEYVMGGGSVSLPTNSAIRALGVAPSVGVAPLLTCCALTCTLALFPYLDGAVFRAYKDALFGQSGRNVSSPIV